MIVFISANDVWVTMKQKMFNNTFLTCVIGVDFEHSHAIL